MLFYFIYTCQIHEIYRPRVFPIPTNEYIVAFFNIIDIILLDISTMLFIFK
jgi:hypothetical protein